MAVPIYHRSIILWNGQPTPHELPKFVHEVGRIYSDYSSCQV